MSPRARVRWLRVTLVVAVAVVALGAAGTVGYLFVGHSPGSSLQAQATEAPVTLAPIPLTTKIVKVAGKLPAKTKTQALNQIGTLLTTYVSDAYLGLYPRTDFSDAYALMDPNLVKYAKQNAGLVTGTMWTTQNVSVDPGTLTANVSLVAVKNKPVGGTAKITWTFQVSQLSADLASSGSAGTSAAPSATSSGSASTTPVTVTVKGSFYLAMTKQGWQIFGYDVSGPSSAGGSGQ